MDSLRVFVLVFAFCSLITALPTFEACIYRYPRAKHSVPLHRTLPSSQGNFEVDVTIGDQTVRADLDTGSADSWFMQKNVQCLDPATHDPISSDKCGWSGPRLTPGSSFKPTGTHSNNSYGSGQTAISAEGYDRVVFGGIDIPKQEIAFATMIAGNFPGHVSGIVGLGYPHLTSAYPGDDPSSDVACSDIKGANNTGCNEQHYSPIMTTIFRDGLAPPIFTLAISRGAPEAGVMTIGGIPDPSEPSVNVTSRSVEVTVPIEKYGDDLHRWYYVITVDSLQYSGAAAGAGNAQYIVDSGTIQLLVGKEQARIVNALFDPPAQYDKDNELWYVYCNATAPDFGVEIGGKVFGINPADMFLALPDNTQVCESAVQGSTAAAGFPPILGNTFLRNVLAVHDVGESRMTFVSRMYYEE